MIKRRSAEEVSQRGQPLGGAPQRLVLTPALFHVFISDQDNDTENTSGKMQMIQNCKEWLIDQMIVASLRGTLSGWRNKSLDSALSP